MNKIISMMLAAVMLLSTLVIITSSAKADDTTSPVISNVMPDQATISTVGTSADVDFAATCKDDVGIVSWTFSVDGSVTGPVAINPPQTPYQFNAMETLGVGSHTLILTVSDGDGNQTQHVWDINIVQYTTPIVDSIIPSNGASNVLVGTSIQITFSEAMDQASVQNAFGLTGGGTSVSGSFSWSSNSVCSFIPSAALQYSAVYTVTIGTGAKSLAGISLALPSLSTFTTQTAPGTIPAISSISPANGANNVSTSPSISMIFSEAMNRTSVEAAFSLSTGATAVAGTFAWSSDSACSFTPSAALGYATTYTVTIGTGAKSLLGQALSTTFTSAFTTAPDTTPPKVTNVSPLDGAVYVDVNTTIIVYFSEAMDQASVQSTFNLSDGISTVQGSFAWAGTALTGDVHVTFKPSAPLQRAVVYAISLSGKDLAGNVMTTFSSQFVTGASPDLTPRILLPFTPTNGAKNVSIKTTIEIAFSLPMNTSSVESAFSLSDGNSTVKGTFSWSGNILTFTPSSKLNESTIYIIKIEANKAISANRTQPVSMAKDFTSQFTTEQVTDITPPTITPVTSIVNANEGIAFVVKDVGVSSGVEWSFLTVKDNGVFYSIPCLIINQTTGKVTIPAPNMIGKHTMQVTVYDMAGNKASLTFNVTVVLPPGTQPTDPDSTDAPQLQCTAEGGKVKITWTTTSPYSYPKLKCIIYRGTSPDALSPLIVVTGNSYEDSSVSNNHQYYYQVRVIYEMGEGPPSSVVGVTSQSTLEDSLPVITVITIIGVVVAAAALGFVIVNLMHKRKK